MQTIVGTKLHLSIDTAKLEESVAFYRALFGAEPLKHYEDYAKFDVQQPPINFTLNAKPSVPAQSPLNHLGLELPDQDAVKQAIEGARAMKLPLEVEGETTCCYGVQDKAWITDPNGILWEIYTILEQDVGNKGGCDVPQPEAEAAAACCAVPAGPGQKPR